MAKSLPELWYLLQTATDTAKLSITQFLKGITGNTLPSNGVGKVQE
jgi:hypothetical protein